MSDSARSTEALKLSDEFPPIPTEAWEAAIRSDLKGADYAKRLLWQTEDGIAIRPYYRAEDVRGLEAFPFVGSAGGKTAPARAESIRADRFHEAGAHAVQELGYALAEGVERLAMLAERRQSVDLAAAEIEFVFAAGSTFFFEIAKLRAARLVWARAVEAFGPEQEAACLMHIHVRTSRRNKSVLDGYTNLLRATTEALSAVIGGCDRLTVEAFGFDEHLALNLQRILREEARVNLPADPGGGAWFLEVLTDSLARESWKLFQEVEAAGGFSAALASGAIAGALAQTRATREKAVALRRRTLVGVNNYPHPVEASADARPPAGDAHGPLTEFRLAEPFEKIRARTARHAQDTGRLPRVLLLKHGDLKMRMARANFSRNFFGCAGFEMQEAEQLEGTDADLIVLCSSDPEYLQLAREVCPRAKVPVVVAGNPTDQIEALKAAGVQGFIHVQSDSVRTLTEWQDRLGLKE